VKASLLLHSQNITHRLILNGKDSVTKERGSMREFLGNLVPEHLKRYFIFAGHQTQEDLYKCYATATAAIFPSFAEAFAFAPMEAMVKGCPTIFTKRVSGPELIDDGKDGILVDPANVEEIAAAIKWMLTHPEEAQALGEAGRQKILSSFNIKAVMPQTLAFYQQAIDNFKAKSK
jgi:glycosyltransferase involved in cell wall biosynthesis